MQPSASVRVFLLTLSVVAGILLADRLPQPLVPPPSALYIVAAVVLGVSLGVGYGLRKAAGTIKSLPLFGFLLVWFLLGAARTLQTQRPQGLDISRFAGGQSVWVRVETETTPETGHRGSQSLIAHAERLYDFNTTQYVTGKLRLTVPDTIAITPGDVVWVRGEIALPQSATNPDAFDYATYLKRHGVFATLTARYPDAIQPGESSRTTLAQKAASQVRAVIHHATDAYLSPDDAALMNGLLLSDRDRLPIAFTEALTRTGMVHILSVSGLHVAALAATVVFLLRLLSVPRGIQAIVSLSVLWLFVLASGCAPAAIRSALMASLFLLAPLVRRTPTASHTLTVATLLLLLWEPGNLWDAGFQLSVATVGALVLYGPLITRALVPPVPLLADMTPIARRAAEAGRWVLVGILIGIVAEAGSALLVVYHFNLVCFVGPFANLAVVLAEGITVIGLCLAGLSWLPDTLLHPLWALAALLLRVLRSWVYAFSALPFASFAVTSPPALAVILYYTALGAGALTLRRHVLNRTLFAPDAAVPAVVPSSDSRVPSTP